MSLKILMIVGVMLAIIGMILGVSTVFNTMRRDIQVFFFRRKLPSMDEDVEKSGKKLGKTALWLITIGLILFLTCYVEIYAPRGPASIFSENIKDDSVKQQETDTHNEEISDLEGTDDTIVIAGETIHFDECLWENDSIENFGSYLDTIEKTRKLSLQDDYAVASVYHRVEELLKEHGIIYGVGKGTE